MNWISIKDGLPSEGQLVDLWVTKNGQQFRETDFEFINSIEFHHIPAFRKKNMNEIVYYIEENQVTHYMIIEIPK